MSKISGYKKEQIIDKALNLVRSGGEDALTARSLGKAIGCSTSPLFTVCGSIEQIKQDVRKAAVQEFEEYVADSLNYIPAFKEYGMRIYRFAKQEPNLFKLVFLSEGAGSESRNHVVMECLEAMREEYKLTEEDTRILLEQVWTYACGIAMLVISGADHFSDEQVSDMLSRQFASTIMFIKSGTKPQKIHPRLRHEGEGATIPLPE